MRIRLVNRLNTFRVSFWATARKRNTGRLKMGDGHEEVLEPVPF